MRSTLNHLLTWNKYMTYMVFPDMKYDGGKKKCGRYLVTLPAAKFAASLSFCASFAFIRSASASAAD